MPLLSLDSVIAYAKLSASASSKDKYLPVVAAWVIAVLDLPAIAKSTALRGPSRVFDPFILCPSIHRQGRVTTLNEGELPATAALTSGYVFRVENQATVYYLQQMAKTGHLTTFTVDEKPEQAHGDAFSTTLTKGDLPTLLYSTPVVLTFVAIMTMTVIRDWWGLTVLLILIFARILNTEVMTRRSKPGWKGIKEPGLTGDLLVLLSQDRWARLQGSVDALKLLTSGQWFREKTSLDIFLATLATLLVYVSAVLTANSSQLGNIVISALLVLSASFLALSNK